MLRLLVDSSADFSLEEYEAKNIEFVSLYIHFDNHSYRDVLEISRDEVYQQLIANHELPKTSQPSPQEFFDIFEDVKEKGDSMVVLLLSSALSGTYQSACLAKDMCGYDQIYIVDSLSATLGLRLLAEAACDLRAQGMEAAVIASRIEELKQRVCIYAAVDTLEYLQKGGRIGKAAAIVGGLANLKPIITVKDGIVHAVGKALGRNKAICTIQKLIADSPIDHTYPVYPVYSYGEENIAKLEEKLSSTEIHFDTRIQIGASIGIHVGPEAYGIVYIAKKKLSE